MGLHYSELYCVQKGPDDWQFKCRMVSVPLPQVGLPFAYMNIINDIVFTLHLVSALSTFAREG